MNILIPDSWLREYLDTPATPKDIQKCLSLCGPSIERTTEVNGDIIYDIEVTTNRVDCMSVYGIAREAVAILPQFGFAAQLKPPSLTTLTPGSIPGFKIQNDFKLCLRAMAVKVDNIEAKPSPQWLQNKLISIGQRPLNCLVDITNYVMWEIGHPTHVFDFDRLTTKKMIIRQAKHGESITTLDNKTHTLLGGEVIIDDGTGNIIDLPSVMGTANSVVIETTKSALFFVDDVVSSKVRFASMRHSIRTQAATLLEKDINPELSLFAMSRLIHLVKQLFPDCKVSNLYDNYKPVAPPPNITFPVSLVSSLIGISITPHQIKNILHRLNFNVEISDDILSVTAPPWRTLDIQIPEDVIEEIARIFGYHNIPPVLMAGTLPSPNYDTTFYWENRIKTALKYLGFTESYTYSLVDKDSGLKLKNPLTSDWVYLRTSLFPSHEKIIAANRGRVDQINLFEIANVYLPHKTGLPEEQSHLILTTTNQDFPKFKGLITALLLDLGIKDLNPDIVSTSNLLYWEIPTTNIISKATDKKTYIPISPFPAIVEDFNITTSETYATLIKQIYQISPLITNVNFIEKYNNKFTLRLIFHDTQKQLSTEDVAPIRYKIQSLQS